MAAKQTQDQPINQAEYDSLELSRAIELLAEKDEQMALLLHRIKQLEKMIYGPRSSKRNQPIDLKELLPFPGLEKLIEEATTRAEERAAQQAKKAAEAPAAKPSRKKGPRSLDDDIPADLPRHRRQRKLDPEACRCGCGGKLVEMREEIARRVEEIKLMYVDERVTTYYACSGCERVVTTAPDQDNIVEGSMFGPNMLANFVYQRFGNHTPYNRLANELAQRGLPVDRTVIGRNVLKCGELLEPIYNHLRDKMLNSFLLQIDDTPVVVRNGKEKGRKTGRIWIYRALDGDVLFDFRMDRSQEGPRRMIGDFHGFVQGDAYSGHDFLFGSDYQRIEIGCWAHVVRRFRDAATTDKKLAAEFDALFAFLKDVEDSVKAMPPPKRFLYRVKHARPVLLEIKDWLDARSIAVAPKSPMGKAIAYAQNHWQALNNYLLDGRITDITNNAAERALRRVAIGRKNWMHIGAEDAGKPAVILMSILQTCVERGVNAVEYLRDVLVRIHQPGSSKDIEALTPLGWQRCQQAKVRVAQTRTAIANVVEELVYRAAPRADAQAGA